MQILEEAIAARNEGQKDNDKQRRSRVVSRQRDWIEERVLEYLKLTPCSQADPNKMPQLVQRLNAKTNEGFDLTDAETLQVLNFMPLESVEIHLMIEDLQSRMPEERQDELLRLIASCRKDDGTGKLMDDVHDEEFHGEEDIYDALQDTDEVMAENGAQLKEENPS
jgi:RNA polymerase Rpb4